MVIKDTIQRMLDSLPASIPDLLNSDQAALVQSCLISLKDLSQQRQWKMVMKFTSASTTAGHRTMLEYIQTRDHDDCMASTAKDLQLFKDRLVIG